MTLTIAAERALTCPLRWRTGAAVVSLDAFITNPVEGQSVEFIVRDAAGVIVAGAVRPAAERVHAEVRIENAHLWQGVKDPYLYAVEALLTVHNETIDNVSANLGRAHLYGGPAEGLFPQRACSRRCAACPAIRTVWARATR